MDFFTLKDSNIKKTGHSIDCLIDNTMSLKKKMVSNLVLVIGLLLFSQNSHANGITVPDAFSIKETVRDTFPLKDRYGDFVTDDSYNPFDINPDNLNQTVEYDPSTNTYVVYERIGDEYYRMPVSLTFEEYLDWKSKKQQRDYFDKLAGFKDPYSKEGSGLVDPLSKINIERNLADRLFGGNEITIEPQGNIDMTFGFDYREDQNPNIDLNRQRQGPFLDFGMDIQMNVEGKIGDKLNLGFNYDTQASFDFDRKIKLAYDSEQFSEDDIIKTIEAGNVSLPLRSNLIQGNQSLFGLKTELQFGHLRITAIASQQRSQQETQTIQNGATLQEFELTPDQYDENRHFFISHYHREIFEDALSNLPYISNNLRITNMEVWISDDRLDYQQNQTMICAIADLAEPDENLFSNPNAQYGIDPNFQQAIFRDSRGLLLPDNRTNELYEQLIDDEETKRIERTNTRLEQLYDLEQPRDFNIFQGRKLNPSEYTLNEQLGFVSLNIRLRPNQVLAVSYEYFYTQACDDVYKVGTISDEGSVPNTNRNGEIESQGVIFAKLLKSTDQRISHPTWDLMMKNVYPLRSNNLSQTDLKFDIFYEDDSDGTLKKFLPEDGFRTIPLLNVFGLDQLNNRNDPQPDGEFDFVPGVTVIPQSSSIVFPVLEPFGSSLEQLLGDPAIAAKYSFNELYDTTVTGAREMIVKNKFIMAGRFKSDITSEYSLGAWNIPPGSVRVTAGSQVLIEGQDYEVDYAIGRVRIINESYLQQGTPINISYEDNSVFSLQQKTLLGLRAEYEVNENFYIGATTMRLFERPFTEKVNLGDDPINNTIYGLDMDFSTEVPFLTRVVDKLPFYSTNAPSNLNFTAEVAALRPGHSGAINLSDDNSGVVSIDDFEGAVSGFPLSSQAANLWILASTPHTSDFPEHEYSDSLVYGANRARLAWYVFDQTLLFGQDRAAANPGNSYTRNINQQDLFRRDIPRGVLGNLLTFDLTYMPDQRGPYNFDPPEGFGTLSRGSELNADGDDVRLKDPETRWAGVMRYMPNSDFEANNYEFVEFWLLNPFLEKPDGSGHLPDEEGFITFHLGNVSEDILADNLQFFENSLAPDSIEIPTKETSWGRVSLSVPKNDGFDRDGQQDQDLGLDGLDLEGERNKYQDYLNKFPGQPTRLNNDPSADDYAYFNDFDEFEQSDNILTRYSKFNNPEGNSPDVSGEDRFVRGNPRPDKEDLNNNRSLDQGESFYEYKIPIRNSMGEIDETNNEFIRDIRIITNPNDSVQEKWYRFRIPIRDGVPINGIEGFRSIQFMRVIVNGFSTQKTFRLADFELVRNQWRKLPSRCLTPDGTFTGNFNVDAVGIEENDKKLPFNYVLPQGIKQERIFNTFSNVLQDEKSLSIVYEGLQKDCELSIYRLNNLDLRLYDKMQMFVHAEEKDGEQESGDVAVFLRVGKDFDLHYYEYEIPLTLSSDSTLTGGISDSERVWPEANMFDFELDWLVQAKKIRNVLGESFSDRFTIDQDTLDQLFASGALNQYKSIGFEGFVDTLTNDTLYLPKGHKVTIIGNPSVGKIKGVQIGIRNIDETGGPPGGYAGEVWVNELRLTGLEERGGVAGQARLDLQIADLGNITAAGSFSTIGWGALDQRVMERQMESVKEYDISTNLQLGNLFPEGWNLSVPFYAQFAKSIVTPEFDAYDLDITVKDEFDLAQDNPTLTEDVRNRNQIVNTIKTFNFTNVKKERGGSNNRQSNNRSNNNNTSKSDKNDKSKDPDAEKEKKPKKPKKPRKPMPWDIENLSVSYAYTQMEYRDPIISSEVSKDYRFGVDYNYSRRGGYIEPFKFIKSKSLEFIKQINFNPLPNSFSFSSNLNRFVSVKRFRIPVTPIFEFDDRRFEWERRYDLNWNLTKSLKMTFSAINESYIDELRQRGIAEVPENRPYYNERGDSIGLRSSAEVKEYWQDNLRSGGRNTNYSHSASVNYTLPFKYFPYMDWIDVKASYRTNYSWAAGPLIDIQDGQNIGNIIQNTQNRSVTANFNFDRLYDKSKYLKKLDRIGKAPTSRSRTRTTRSGTTRDQNDTVGKDENKRDKKKEKEPGAIEKLLLRPLFMLRSVQFNYKEDFSTIVPGFVPGTRFLGLSDGFEAPGFDFAFGIQPDVSFGNQNNWLFSAADKGWITTSTALNQEVIQTQSQNLEAKIRIEPWKDFRINVDFKKSYRATEQQDFKFIDKDGFADFAQLAYRNVGSFEMTFFALNTLIGGDVDALFSQFERNRSIISFRLDNATGAGSHEQDGREYAAGYGKTSSQVLVPAFLAAYTDQDPNTVSLDLENDVRGLGFIPRPNWSLRYDGLNKLPWFKETFSSFTLEHGYSSMLRVNNFYSDVEYDAANPYEDIKPNGNYYSRLEIPFMQISEQFNPVIGLRMKTRSDLNIDFEYKTSRTLDLSVNVATELLENKKSEYVFGFGYTIKDSNFLKGKNKSRRSRRPRTDEEPDPNDQSTDRGRRGRNNRNVNSSRGSDMTIMFTFSLIDDVSLVHELDFGETSERTRGAKTISFSPSVDYILNENLTIRAFFEYTGTRPYVTNNFPFTAMNGGITMRMTLN